MVVYYSARGGDHVHVALGWLASVCAERTWACPAMLGRSGEGRGVGASGTRRSKLQGRGGILVYLTKLKLFLRARTLKTIDLPRKAPRGKRHHFIKV